MHYMLRGLLAAGVFAAVSLGAAQAGVIQTQTVSTGWNDLEYNASPGTSNLKLNYYNGARTFNEVDITVTATFRSSADSVTVIPGGNGQGYYRTGLNEIELWLPIDANDAPIGPQALINRLDPGKLSVLNTTVFSLAQAGLGLLNLRVTATTTFTSVSVTNAVTATFAFTDPSDVASFRDIGTFELDPQTVTYQSVTNRSSATGLSNTGKFDVTVDYIDAPEPATFAVFGAGVAAFGLVRRRRARA